MDSLTLLILTHIFPFLALFFIAVEVITRNPHNPLHRITTALLVALGFLHFSNLIIMLLQRSDALWVSYYLKTPTIFVILSLSTYFYGFIARVNYRRWWTHAVCLLPLVAYLIGMIALDLTPAMVIDEAGVWKEDYNVEFGWLITSITAYTFTVLAIFLRMARLHARETGRSNHRVRIIQRGAIIAIAVLLTGTAILFALDQIETLLLELVSIATVLVWAGNVRYAMLKYDFLSATNRRYELLFKMTHQGLVLLDERCAIVEANEAFLEMAGDWSTLRNRFQEWEEFSAIYHASFQSMKPFQREVTLTHPEHGQQTVDLQCDYMEMNGYTYAFLVVQDITERKMNEKKLLEIAYYDSLTGLGNRRLFMDRVNDGLERLEHLGEGASYMIMLLDIDQFRWINDTLGHTAGDEVLIHVARKFEAAVPIEAVTARLGGDEFAVMLYRDANEEGAIRQAQALLDCAKDPVYLSDKPYTITFSIGICLMPRDGRDADSVLRNVDSAMYKAKNGGRNQYQFYSPAFSMVTETQLHIVNGFAAAMNNGEFSLHYQPQIDMDSGQVFGVEALLRWNSAELGQISPNVFIPLAEETGHIVQIGRWVMQTAMKQAKLWVDEGFTDLLISINLSASQLRMPDFAEQVAGLLEECGLSASNLCLEITESTAITDMDTTLRICKQLVSQGIRLAIDDFGTGYSSLSMLNRFPFHYIKIDRSLIQDIAMSKRDLAVIRTLVELSDHMSASIIAEGVETGDQADLLIELGCREAQGYWFGKPMDTERISRYLANRAVS